jgi:hypothetical protein
MERFMAEQAALVAACKLLVAAANAHEAQEDLQRAGLLSDDAGALATLQSGDLVTIARNALYRLLAIDGWVPPEDVRDWMAADKLLIDESVGSAGG